MLSFSKKIILLVCCVFPTLSYANYTITPVKVQIAPKSMMTSLTIENNNDESRNFQLTVYKVDGHGSSKPSEMESKDLVVTPAMFKVAGKKSQMIRIAVKNQDAFKHQNYVVSIKELPHGAAQKNAIQMISDFRVPVLVGETSVEVND